MFSHTSYVIRKATDQDLHAVNQLTTVAGERPLSGDVLVGEIGGRVAAAISILDYRIVSDTFGVLLGLPNLLLKRARAGRSRFGRVGVTPPRASAPPGHGGGPEPRAAFRPAARP